MAIIAQMKAAEAYPDKIETPLSRGVAISVLNKSENPGEKMLADILGAVQALQSDMGKMAAAVVGSSRPEPSTARRRLEELIDARSELQRRVKALKVLEESEPTDSNMRGDIAEQRSTLERDLAHVEKTLEIYFTTSITSPVALFRTLAIGKGKPPAV